MGTSSNINQLQTIRRTEAIELFRNRPDMVYRLKCDLTSVMPAAVERPMVVAHSRKYARHESRQGFSDSPRATAKNDRRVQLGTGASLGSTARLCRQGLAAGRPFCVDGGSTELGSTWPDSTLTFRDKRWVGPMLRALTVQETKRMPRRVVIGGVCPRSIRQPCSDKSRQVTPGDLHKSPPGFVGRLPTNCSRSRGSAQTREIMADGGGPLVGPPFGRLGRLVDRLLRVRGERPKGGPAERTQNNVHHDKPM